MGELDIVALAAGLIPMSALHACDKMQSSGKCENNCRTCAIIIQMIDSGQQKLQA